MIMDRSSYIYFFVKISESNVHRGLEGPDLTQQGPWGKGCVCTEVCILLTFDAECVVVHTNFIVGYARF